MADADHYTVLARRFRPQTFDEVVGQHHVAQALKNAIRTQRVAHAYLFTGARGVGKTSTARILAKALNCPSATDGDPCNACEICEAISAGQDVDISEIDGASNRGIEDIRQLRANVTVKSMRSKFKMYIIDEVHMLTTPAFNALLKTLEEPPANVKFVFCTTEANKVPDTILSRCQRFDFNTVDVQNIIGRLTSIADAENYEVEPGALELIARRANGSMRDSQSLFDQLLAFAESPISTEDVHRLFGTADDERLISLMAAVIERDRSTSLAELNDALGAGVQLSELVDQLLHYLRDLMVLATGSESVPLLGVAESSRAKLIDQANTWGVQTAMASLQILSEAKTRMFRASYGRALVEMAIVRMSMLDDLSQIDSLLAAARDGDLSLAPAATAAPKKNDPVEPPAAKNVVEFAAGNEQAILSQLVARLKGPFKTQVQQATSVAIFEPNRLELSFPASYHFGKEALERPDKKAELEQHLAEICGRPVQLSFQLLKAEANSEPEKPSERAEKPVPQGEVKSQILRSDAGIEDPFVKQAIEVFSATPVKKEDVRAPQPEEPRT